MKPSPKKGQAAKNFPGLITNADPGDIPVGAAVQQHNIQSVIPGQLNVRKGWRRAARFNRADIGSVSRADLTNIYRYRHTLGDKIITVNAAGEVAARKNNTVSVIASNTYGDTSWSFTRDRCGALIGVNGYGRGIYWEGNSGTAGKLGLDPPTAAPVVTIQNPGGVNGIRSFGTAKFYYRYVAGTNGIFHYSNLSPATTIVIEEADLGSEFVWSGLLNSSQNRVHTIELWRSLPGDENTLYLVGSLRAGLFISSFAAYSPSNNLAVTFSGRHNYSVGSVITISGSVADNGSATITEVVNEYTVRTGAVYSGTPTPINQASVYGAGYKESFSDTQLQDAAVADANKRLLIVSNGELVANRFVPPPPWKHSIAKLQDRTFYAADTTYQSGYLGTTVGNPSVSLLVPSFWNSPDIGARQVQIEGESSYFSVLSFGNTQINVDPAPTATSTQRRYAIRPMECERNAIYYSEPDEPQSVPRTNIITIQEQAEDEDEIVGIHAFGPYLYVLKEHHIYTVSFVRQPRIDAQARLLCHRGAFNKNCWDTHEGVAYLMDSEGCYVMGMNGAFESISDSIQDLWRDGTIDVTNTYWFHVKVDARAGVVRYYVRFTGDLGTRPRRALCYNIRTGAWWTETGPMEVAACVSIDEEGERYNLGAGQNDIVLDLARGESDMVATEIRGTCASSTPELIADLTANFDQSVVGAPIAFLDGNCRGQVRTILSVVTPQVVSVSATTSPLFNYAQNPFTEPPADGSRYIIGGIYYAYRIGTYDLVVDDDHNRRAAVVDYRPTEKEYHIWSRRYLDQKTTPENNWDTQSLGGSSVQTIQGTPETWINTKRELYPASEQPGVARLNFSGKKEDLSSRGYSVSIDLDGIKGDEAIEIYEITLEGID